jgi:RNA polymerase sigma-70 factor (ECF subfamily)
VPFSDQRLRDAAGGDPEAISSFIDFYWPRIHRTASLITGGGPDAEDVAQDVVLRAVGALPDLDLSSSIEPWIDRVSANAARDWLRKRSRRAEVLVEEPPVQEADTAWADRVDAGIFSETLLSALRALSDEQRAVIVLRHLLDMRATEVAAHLGIAEGTARSLDHRALNQLRHQLDLEEVADAR